MKIGVSSYSFSQYMLEGKLDYVTSIKQAADMGFDAIEFIDIPNEISDRKEFAENLRQEAADKNIEISAYVICSRIYGEAQAQKAEVERVKGELDIANILGVKLFRYDVLATLPRYTSFDKVVENVVPAMREIADYGEKLGIKTMIENHGHLFQDYDRIEKLHSAVNHKNFGLLLDIGNFLCADQDNVFCVSRLAGLAVHVHLKDFVKQDYYYTGSKENYFCTRAGNFLMGVAVGDGDAKTAQCLTILKNAGYKGYVDIEYEGVKDCVEEIAKGLEFVKNC